MNSKNLSLETLGIKVAILHRNLSVATLYELALQNEKGSSISSTGALICSSGSKTGRSPNDKRIVRERSSEANIWWGNVNVPLDKGIYEINRERAIDFFNTKESLYVVDGFAGADEKHRLKVRIVCTRAYHALFMHNMLIRPTAQELAEFGEPDFVIMNAGQFPANSRTASMTSKTSISLSLENNEMVILGSEYAGEMKKGIFTLFNYLMPKKGVLSMHCSANEGSDDSVSLFFGLSGTGKTTLSADARRSLIGDDEICWTDDGVFNIEGGCYAKCINLSAEGEPEIFNSIRFGSVLENVVYDEKSREVDYTDCSLTQNTRCSYPVEYIPNSKLEGTGGHPNNVVFLSCDAFGVLPPVSKLTSEQAMYHFITGYTSKLAGTEMGITEPQATFSACFGAAFLMWHPYKYAELLAEKIKKHNCNVWLVNTGWCGGQYGTGSRISLKDTRRIIDAINSGELANAEFLEDEIFGLRIPAKLGDISPKILNPRLGWQNESDYLATATNLARMYNKNFAQYADKCPSQVVKLGGPRVS